MTSPIPIPGAIRAAAPAHATAKDDRAQQIAARVRPALESDLAVAHLSFGAPLYLRIFKQERSLEVWLRADSGQYRLFRSYPICQVSGALGPKQKEGDRQAPEGFYRVGLDQLHPGSQFHLAFNLGYPNAYDRAHGRTGSSLMVHGRCVSTGCYAMGDAGIEEIYTLAEAALRGGQEAFAVHIYPMRLTSTALAANEGSPWLDFWRALQPAYTFFERERIPPLIETRHGNYFVTSGREEVRR